MTIIIICLLIAIILPYLAKLPVGYAMQKAPGGYDNNHPREQCARLTGFGARAVAAHQNSFESLTVFATAAITALAVGQVGQTIQILAMIYIAARVVYHFLYLFNYATLRSTVWFISYICCLEILWLCIPK